MSHLKFLEQDSRLATIAILLATATAYALLDWSLVSLTNISGRFASLWVPNAIIVGLIVGTTKQRAMLMLCAACVGELAGNLLLGDPLLRACGLTAANLTEIYIVYWGMHRLVGTRPDITEIGNLWWFSLLGGVAAPLVSGVLAFAVLAGTGEGAAFLDLQNWVVAHALGMLLIAPLVIVLLHALTTRRVARVDWRSWVVLVGFATAGTAAVFVQSTYPYLFIVTALVVMVAHRLGIVGSALITVIVAVIASIATSMDIGPISLVKDDTQHIFALQVFLISTFACSLPVASSLAARTQLRRELEQSRDALRMTMDNAGDVIFRGDGNGRWSFLNNAWEELTGYTVEESLGREVTELIEPESLPEVEQGRAMIHSGELDEVESTVRFRRRDGEVRVVEVTLRAVRDSDGTLTGSAGTIHDVTDTSLALAALRESEERFQTLADLSPAGIFRTAISGECTYVNAAWLNLAGISYEQAMGFGWGESIHPEDRDELVADWLAAVASGGRFRKDFRFLRPDSSIRWVTAIAAPDRNSMGELRGFIGVNLDITEKVLTGQALDEERERFKYLAENITDAIVVVTREHICRYASPSFKELTGYAPEEVEGRPPTIELNEEDLPVVVRAHEEMFAGERESAALVYRVRHRSGEWQWHESQVRLIRDTLTNEPLECIASIRDVTHREELEEQLRIARDAAEGAAVAKSEFLANMSHEIRTPMNGVIGFADLLLNSGIKGQARHYAERIVESGQTMVSLVNDILDLSKIDAGKMELNIAPMRLDRVVEINVEQLRGAADEKGIGLELDLAGDFTTHVCGDRLRISQVLTNLLSNAIKFTERGKVSVFLTRRAPDLYEFSVADTGIGIPQSRLDAIFEEFVQADNSTARVYGGTGLGLAISRRLTEKMGGEISVESDVGKGTIFSFTLPLDPAGHARMDDDTAPTAAPAGVFMKRRILVAEDHAINQELIGILLDQCGHDHDLAGDGALAVDMVDAAIRAGRPYDLVLMDMQMPKVDGITATRRIREKGIAPEQLPIIALTANAFATDIERCLAAGMQAHVAKPVQLAVLRPAIDAVLRGEVKRPSSEHAEESAAEEKLSAPSPDDPMEALRQRYLVFRQEVIDAVAGWHALPLEQRPAEAQRVKDMLHKLAGSAGMFGEGDLGTLAREAEGDLERYERDQATTGDSEAISRILTA